MIDLSLYSIIEDSQDHAPFSHNLVYLAGKLSLEFSKEQIELLEEMTGFNLEARYPDEQMEFYKTATKEFAGRFKKAGALLREWLKKKSSIK